MASLIKAANTTNFDLYNKERERGRERCDVFGPAGSVRCQEITNLD